MQVLIADGGGTKTRAWLIDWDSKKTLETVEFGASNIARVGEEGLEKVFSEILASLTHNISLKAVALGLAGVGRDAERNRALTVAKKVFSPCEVFVTTDAHMAYRGAFAGGKNGVMLIAGTGSIAFYQNPQGHEFFRAGGWGPLLGDEGGGTWLGREVLRQCLFEWEVGEFSPLQQAVLRELELDDGAKILTKVYSENYGTSEWAKLAPLAFKFSHEVLSAERMLKKLAVELIDLAERVEEMAPQNLERVPLVVMGGLWEQRALLEPLMAFEIKLRNLPFVFTEPVGGPLEGGIKLLEEKFA